MVFVQTFAYIGYANATSSSTATNEIEESFENGVLTLSGSGAIDSSAYKGRTDIQTLIINNGITSIGTSAFSGCTNLSSVTLANTVTAISNSAFYGCSGITEIELPPAIERLAGQVSFSVQGNTIRTNGEYTVYTISDNVREVTVKGNSLTAAKRSGDDSVKVKAEEVTIAENTKPKRSDIIRRPWAK